MYNSKTQNFPLQKDEISHYILSAHQRLRDLAHSSSGKKLNHTFSKAIDRLLVRLYTSNLKLDNERSALIALGGYGRKEMAPFSDIDLLILYEPDIKKDPEEVVSRVGYPLWDSGVEANITARSVEECIHVAREDVRSLTSMLDSRLIAGNAILFKRLISEIQSYFFSEDVTDSYIKKKHEEYLKRLEKQGNTVFVAEPNIKESMGGLRCYQTSIWMLRALSKSKNKSNGSILQSKFISKDKIKGLIEAVDFLWRLRALMHLVSNRRQDILDYETQFLVAPEMGFGGSGVDGALKLMEKYYKSASDISYATELIIEKALETGCKKGQKGGSRSDKVPSLSFKSGIVTEGNLLEPFLIAHRQKQKLPMETIEQIRTSLNGISLSPPNRDINKHFREILKDPIGLDYIISAMFASHVIFRIIPEFQGISCKVGYGTYHMYTVDAHTVKVLHEVSRLASGDYRDSFPEFSSEYTSIKRPELLNLAGLFHDIGKGTSESGRHEIIGADIAKDVLLRLGYEPEVAGFVRDVIKLHIAFPHIAFRRDINDPSLLGNFAEEVGDLEKLTVLYLLAFADIRSAGAKVWSNWKRQLLTELYMNTKNIISGEDSDALRAGRQAKEDEIKKALGEGWPKVEAWLKEMPPRYVQHMPSSDILLHFNMLNSISGNSAELLLAPSDHYHTITILTKDMIGLFAKICYAFLKNGINILEAHLYTGSNGDVVDIFKVVNQSGMPIYNLDIHKLKKDLIQAIAMDADMLKIDSFRPKYGLLLKDNGYTKTDVVVDSDVSADYTIVEVHTLDRMGLLYKIAYWLYSKGYYIHTAKAVTIAGNVIDVFYISKGGKKITSSEEIRGIRDGILETIYRK